MAWFLVAASRRQASRSRSLLTLCAFFLLVAGPFHFAYAASNYSRDFNDNTALSWSARSYDGVQTYTATTGYYTNDNHNTLWSIATYDADTWTTDFTYSADIFSQYNGGTANALGLIYGYQDSSNYYKVWFNTFGEAHLYRVSAGTQTEVVGLGQGSGVAGKNWYTIKIVRSGANTSVFVNNAPLFTNVSQPEITAAGKIGLIGEWNEARFDNVAVTLNGYAQNFDSNTAPNWSSSSYDGAQTFTATGGYYTNDNHNTLWSIATYNGASWVTDFTYSADIFSQYNNGTANALGLIYGYQDSSNYYKVWFNTFGAAHLYRVSGGTQTEVVGMTENSGVAGKTWYTIKIVRSGASTSVFVNNAPLFSSVSQPEITAPGKIGLIGEWNEARFDNVIVSTSGSSGSASDNPPFPRVGGVDIGFPQNASDPHYGDPAYQAALARQHVIILGMYPGAPGGGVTMESVVEGIKSHNSDARVFLYVNENELAPASGTDVWGDVRTKFNTMQWWLYDANTHNPVHSSFNSSYLAMNNTHWTPTDSAQLDSVGWLTQYFTDTYYQLTPAIDGFFMDNVFAAPTIDGDWNRDGINDLHADSGNPLADTDAARWLRSGYVEYVNDVRQRMPGKTQIGNIGGWTLRNGHQDQPVPTEYQDLFDGGVLEAIMGETWSLETWAGWDTMMRAYRATMAAVLAPKFVIFNVHGSATDYRKLRYGLTSCLMDDGYFSYSDMSKGYLGVLWFDEFNTNLGAATSPPPTAPVLNSVVYRRDFQNGIAIVNPTSSTATLNLGGTFRKINGTQDPTVNNGATVTSVTLNAHDGMILLR